MLSTGKIFGLNHSCLIARNTLKLRPVKKNFRVKHLLSDPLIYIPASETNRPFATSLLKKLLSHLAQGEIKKRRIKQRSTKSKHLATPSGNSLVLHCASLLRTIFASSARAHELVHVQNVRDFPQTKLNNGINSPFLLNELGDPQFFFRYLLSTV